MTVDEAFDRAAAKLREASERAAASGGLAAKLAGPLNEDAHFVKKLKPSLVRERLRGGSPTVELPVPPSSAPEPAGRGGGGPSPLVLVGAAFAVGVLLAKLVDWRGHAHPRR